MNVKKDSTIFRKLQKRRDNLLKKIEMNHANHIHKQDKKHYFRKLVHEEASRTREILLIIMIQYFNWKKTELFL